MDKDRKPKINSKAKGADYELKICKVLAEWYQEEFHRVPASGGLRWGKDNRVSGDIIPQVGSTFPFSIECKKREDWTFEQVLRGTGEVESWWTQCTRDAANVDKKPLLIFSKNRAPDYYMMDAHDYTEIMIQIIQRCPEMDHFVLVRQGRSNRVMGLLRDFTDQVSKADIVKAYHLQRRVGI